jgi:hypothetical protein
MVERPGRRGLLQQVGQTLTIGTEAETVGRYEAAVALAGACHADLWAARRLGRLYPMARRVPVTHMRELARQIAEQAGGTP